MKESQHSIVNGGTHEEMEPACFTHCHDRHSRRPETTTPIPRLQASQLKSDLQRALPASSLNPDQKSKLVATFTLAFGEIGKKRSQELKSAWSFCCYKKGGEGKRGIPNVQGPDYLKVI